MLGIVAAAVAVQVAAPGSSAQPPVLDDGTINVTASEQGRGAWVPYTITRSETSATAISAAG